MKNIIKIIIFISGIMVIFGIFSLTSVYGKSYFLPCSQFLNISELEKWENQYKNDIVELKKTLEGGGYMEYDVVTCPGKVGIMFYYNGKSDKKIITSMANNIFYFRDIPYKLVNF